MTKPLMPKATALWLVRHSQLSQEQIGDFCGFHPLELKVLTENGFLQELDPIANGQLTQEEIQRCEKDPSARLRLADQGLSSGRIRKQYTPLSKRVEIPNVILWIVRNYPHVTDAKICSFFSTTKNTVKNIREGSHWNSKQLVPKDPVSLGFCSQDQLDQLILVR